MTGAQRLHNVVSYGRGDIPSLMPLHLQAQPASAELPDLVPESAVLANLGGIVSVGR